MSMKSSRHDHVIFIAELVQHFQKCYNKNTSIMIDIRKSWLCLLFGGKM